jgi:hypothetical protein
MIPIVNRLVLTYVDTSDNNQRYLYSVLKITRGRSNKFIGKVVKYEPNNDSAHVVWSKNPNFSSAIKELENITDNEQQQMMQINIRQLCNLLLPVIGDVIHWYADDGEFVALLSYDPRKTISKQRGIINHKFRQEYMKKKNTRDSVLDSYLLDWGFVLTSENAQRTVWNRFLNGKILQFNVLTKEALSDLGPKHDPLLRSYTDTLFSDKPLGAIVQYNKHLEQIIVPTFRIDLIKEMKERMSPIHKLPVIKSGEENISERLRERLSSIGEYYKNSTNNINSEDVSEEDIEEYLTPISTRIILKNPSQRVIGWVTVDNILTKSFPEDSRKCSVLKKHSTTELMICNTNNKNTNIADISTF